MILVTGATGQVGGELIPQLFDRNESVRALTRDAGKLAPWGDRVQPAIGSFDQPDTLVAAMQGVDRLFLMSADVGAGHVAAAVNAAAQAGVRRVVYLSSLGAHDTSLLIGKWHHDREEAIRASGLAWTILRPGYFMSNTLMWAETIRTQGAAYFPGGTGQAAPIDPHDIAAVAAVALTEPGHAGKTYGLTGDELLTTGQMVAILARVLDRPLRYIDVTPADARDGMIKSGMPVIMADAVAQLYTRLGEGRGALTTELTQTVERITGRKPRTFDAWCRDHLALFQ